jgi:drug/metabolite transporter (DMT)-like permease
VLLAAVLLRERISRAQAGGLALAVLAVVLVTVG